MQRGRPEARVDVPRGADVVLQSLRLGAVVRWAGESESVSAIAARARATTSRPPASAASNG